MEFRLFCFILAVESILGRIVSPPRSLEVNYKQTYEEYTVKELRHLPIIEVFKSDSTIKLPIFSWTLYDEYEHELYNISQKYYEIELYHEHYNEYGIERNLLWKSDKLKSNKHFCNLNHLSDINVDFKNIFKLYKWEILSYRIRSKYNKNQLISSWSNFGRFIVTSALITDWNNASYIAQQTDSPFNIASPQFSKIFTVNSDKTISSAVISIIGLGFFRFYINNYDILNLQQPSIYQIGGWTNTNFRVPYATFDIVSYLQKNENKLIVFLGEGYRNQTAYPYGGRSTPANRSKNDSIDCILKLQLIIKYNDNTQDIIITNNSWQTASTKIILSSIYNGEIYDENAQINNIQNVITVIGPLAILYPTVQPYVTINKIINPLDTIYSLSSHNSQIIDFGENNAGIVRINVGNLGLKKGDQINMKFAEIKQHPPYGPMNGELYYDNLRTAQQYDTFISNGNSSGYYTPYFTMHGFRYMEVWGYPRILTTKDVQKLLIYSNVKMRANWSSSDEVLNSVNKRCINGQLSNLKSVPTDCNQRDERLGWMGDASLTSDSFAINFDMKSYFLNYLQLIVDEQYENGSIPEVVPYYRYGFRPADPNWGIAFPQIINVLYDYYGVNVIKQYMNEPTSYLPKYIQNLQLQMPKYANGSDNISKYPGRHGDWVPPPPNPKISNNFAGAFGYISTVRIVKKLANIIGNSKYVNDLNELEINLSNEFINAFYSNNKYLSGLQTSYAMALYAEIYSNNSMKELLQTNLVKQIVSDNNLLTTGIIGTKYILPILYSINKTNMSLNLIKGNKGVNKQINASYPSWTFEQEIYYEPATAIWELWDAQNESAKMNSRNHHMYSSVSGYLTTDISGIKNRKYYCNQWDISIGHLLFDELKWSKFESDNGLIKYNWEWINKNKLNINIKIPFGHFGYLYFKLKNKQCVIIENKLNHSVITSQWKVDDIEYEQSFMLKYDAKINDKGSLIIGSGNYQWTILCNNI